MSDPSDTPRADGAQKRTRADPEPAAAPARPRFAPGEPVDRAENWVLERPLGQGGFGEVWLARHEWKDERRAVKFCTHPDVRHRLIAHEKSVLLRVMRKAGDHPNIVPLLEYSLKAEVPWLMYEFVDGGTLVDLIRQSREYRMTRRIGLAVMTLRGIACALAQLHQLDPPLVHRDLKPANVLMAGHTPRVTDFGIGGAGTAVASALAVDQSALIPTILRGQGTALYAPPEQLFGSRPHPRDDVYALGIIAYQMLTADVENAPGTDVYEELRRLGVPKDLVALVVASIDFNPDRRPGDAREWESRLSKLLGRKSPATEPDHHIAPHAAAEADFQRGKDFDLGRGVPQDHAKAREWYEKAARQGHANAQNNLGVLYARGEGGPRDYVKAREWYEKAAAQGHAPAQFNLAGLYASGEGGPRDYAKAREWYEKAAAQGHDSAQSNLGRFYKYGYGVEKNLEVALDWFRKAAANGNKRAKKAAERLEKRK